MNNKNKIIIEGVEYTPEELKGYYEELMKTPDEIKSSEPLKNKQFEKAFFLTDDDFGKEIHNKVISNYSDINDITKINLGKGSNPFYVVAVNEVLKEKYPKIRTATQADLERILRENLLGLKGYYDDSGLVWRSNQEPNEYLAKNLSDQFKTKNINLKSNSAYVINLQNLSLKKDDLSPHKVSFVIPSGFTDYFEAPILNEVSQQKFDSSNIDIQTGITKKVSNSGNRKLYTRNWDSYSIKNSGLVRLYLSRNLDLDSYIEGLTYSVVDGRVVLVSARGDAS